VQKSIVSVSYKLLVICFDAILNSLRMGWDGMTILIEVKSRATGTLKSLHNYMDIAPHNFAIRFYAGALIITKANTQKGKHF
jgi:hypothetical protein